MCWILSKEGSHEIQKNTFSLTVVFFFQCSLPLTDNKVAQICPVLLLVSSFSPKHYQWLTNRKTELGRRDLSVNLHSLCWLDALYLFFHDSQAVRFIYLFSVNLEIMHTLWRVINLEWICNILCFPVPGRAAILFSTNVKARFIKLFLSRQYYQELATLSNSNFLLVHMNKGVRNKYLSDIGFQSLSLKHWRSSSVHTGAAW